MSLDSYERRHLTEAMYQFDTHKYRWFQLSVTSDTTIVKADGHVEIFCPNCGHTNKKYVWFDVDTATAIGCVDCGLSLARIFLNYFELWTTSIQHPFYEDDGISLRRGKAVVYLCNVDFWDKNNKQLRKIRYG